MAKHTAWRTGLPELLRRFQGDQSGSYVLMVTLLMPVLVGSVGLATESGMWMYKHRVMQSAADSGAYSAATAYVKDVETGATTSPSQITSQAQAVTATYGFVDGASGVTVTVNWPYGGNNTKVEVILEQPQIPLLYGALQHLLSGSSGPVVLRARAVAAGTPGVPATTGTPGNAGNGCVLALDKSASGAIAAQGTSNVVLDGCSIYDNSGDSSALTATGSSHISAAAVNVVGGIAGVDRITTPDNNKDIVTGTTPATDPYSGVPTPVYSNGIWTLGSSSSQHACDLSGYNPGKGSYTIGPSDPNTIFVICGANIGGQLIAMSLNAGVTVTLRPGIYIFDRGLVQINGQATLIGNNVTLVFTSSTGSNWATASFNGGSNISLSAPTSGPTRGLVVYADRHAPAGTQFQFNGGSTQIMNGAIYIPTGTALFAGGSGTSQACTELVANRITFTGNSNFKIGCSNGAVAIGSTQATPGTPGTPETVLLVE